MWILYDNITYKYIKIIKWKNNPKIIKIHIQFNLIFLSQFITGVSHIFYKNYYK